MWPSPRASAITNGDANFLKRKAEGKVSTPKLGTAVKMWRTPDAHEWKNRSCSNQIYLEDQIMQRPRHPKKAWPTPRVCDPEGGPTEAYNDGRGWYRTNKAGVRWGVKLKDAVHSSEKWPTPSAQIAGEGPLLDNVETKDGELPERNQRVYNPKTGKHIQVTLNRAVKLWPTPRAKGQEGYDTRADRKGHDIAMSYLESNVEYQERQRGGQLNPDWVEWLMGWPISWTSLEPLTELLWLDWSVDPADGLEPDTLGTPRATEAIRSHEFGKGRTPSPEEYVKAIPTPRATDWKAGGWHGDDRTTSVTGYAKYGKGAGIGPIPRVATGIKNRVNRLKAIGNGMVPQCVAVAWKVLVPPAQCDSPEVSDVSL